MSMESPNRVEVDAEAVALHKRLLQIIDYAIAAGCDGGGWDEHFGLDSFWAEIVRTRKHYKATGRASDLPPLKPPVVRRLLFDPGSDEPEVIG